MQRIDQLNKQPLIEIVSNKIHPKVRLNAICPYFTMFPLSFPYKALLGAPRTATVYDPFCGRGTTNYAARLLGLSSVGVDSNPVAHAIAQAKLIQARPAEIRARCLDILEEEATPPIPEGEFWQLAYHRQTLEAICKIRVYMLGKSRLDRIDVALRAIVLGILHGPRMKTQDSYLSNQMPRTFSTKPDYSVRYWKKHGLLPSQQDLVSLVFRKAGYTFNEQLPEKVAGKIVLADSRKVGSLSGTRFDRVITSPPYFGMTTYEQDQWLRNWFLGGPEKVDYCCKSQLKHGSEAGFIQDLASVWANTARKCRPGAVLISRFGALPSKSDKTPAMLMKESLALADCGWRVQTIRSAGHPVDSKRQSNQMSGGSASYVDEIDVYAILNT